MSSDYLHGSETKEKNNNNMVVRDADTSNVCVIGTKPTFLLDNSNDIEKVVDFGESARLIGNNINGFTLPDAVETILTESGGANIYTINIFDNEKHTVNVEKTIIFDENNLCALEETGIQELVLKQGEKELVLGEDYEFENNVIEIMPLQDVSLSAAVGSETLSYSAKYKYCDFSKITDSDVIGSIDKNGKRTGLQKIWDIIGEYGIIPGIIIAPGFTSKNVRNAIMSLVDKIEAYSYLDCDSKTTIPLAEKARLKEIDGVDLTGSFERGEFCAPYVYRYNSYQNTTKLKPLSPVLAGIRVRLDRERNVAKSTDNTTSKTIVGLQYPISFMLNKTGTDSNRFNALGITTVINYKGNYQIWGARNSSYPLKSGLMTFNSARRTRDFINKSVRESSFVCVGENITRGFIDDVLNAINSKFATWSNPLDIDNYIIYGGEAYYDESLNKPETIADGHIYFSYNACPLANTERITFYDVLDISIITKALSA